VPREKKRKDELTLRVLEGGKERAFYLDSGGGQVMQSVAMRIALARLVQRRTGSAWSTLFMDEIFGSLDAVNRKAMADLLTTTLIKEFGFKQVFIISHVPGIQSATADVVSVFRRKGGYSEVHIN
jgi:DNA repair exonuclease SbcCD ATPase subunit